MEEKVRKERTKEKEREVLKSRTKRHLVKGTLNNPNLKSEERDR